MKQSGASVSSIPYRAYVVNLARCRERLVLIDRQLRSLGIAYETFDAVDGTKLSREDRRQYSAKASRRTIGRPLAKGEIGCALSHLHLYREMLNSGDERILVLEDDIVLDSEFVPFLSALASHDFEWDCINFSNQQATVTPCEWGGIYQHYRIGTFGAGMNGTFAYLMSRSGARQLIEHGYPVRRPADDLIGHGSKDGVLAVYGVSSSLVRPSGAPSTIFADKSEYLAVKYGSSWRSRVSRTWLGACWRRCRGRA